MEPYQLLEKEIGDWAGFPPENVVACSSGTAALHLAFEALELPAGSECLVPDYTMVACARAVVLAGLVPVFVDCDERLLIDLNLATDIGFSDYKPDACAALFVHVYGRAMDMVKAHLTVVDCNDCYVVEDLAEAHGVRPHPSTDAACWSFYRNKIVAGEEGGAVAFRKPAHAAVARSLRSLGFGPRQDYVHRPRGMNYRLANLLAEPIRRSLHIFRSTEGVVLQNGGVAKTILEARKEIEGWYEDACPPEWRMPKREAPWVYDVWVPVKKAMRDLAVERLNEAGIAVRPGFVPMSQQEEFFGKCRVVKGGQSLPGEVPHVYSLACVLGEQILYLPIQPGVTTPETVRRSFDVIRSVVG